MSTVGSVGQPIEMELIKCACGCGELFPRYDKRGRDRRYIMGQQRRKNPLEDTYPLKTTYRRRGRKKFREYHGVTLSRDVWVHHIDGDITNNEIWNLQAMQDSDHLRHHQLIYDKYSNKFQELYDKGYSDRKIAREIGCSHPVIGKWRRKQGLKVN